MADEPEKPRVSPPEGWNLLSKQYFEWGDFDGPGYDNWVRVTRFCIEKAFGRNHPNIKEFMDITFDNQRGREMQRALLQAYMSQLIIEGNIWSKEQAAAATRELEAAQREEEAARKREAAALKKAEVAKPLPSNKVFIVHGHDGELKEAVARVVSKFNLEPVILHEQARQGRPIIENFSIHAKDLNKL
jgi:hypothetical protein